MLERIHSQLPRIALALSLLVSIFASQRALGQRESGSVSVSATNAPHVRATIEREPSDFVITDEDIARGFLEILDAVVIELQTNNPEGTRLMLSLGSGPVTSIEVTSGGATRTVGKSGGWIDIPYSGTAAQRFEISARLTLPADAKAGSVSWPLELDARMNGSRSPRLAVSCRSCQNPTAGATGG